MDYECVMTQNSTGKFTGASQFTGTVTNKRDDIMPFGNH